MLLDSRSYSVCILNGEGLVSFDSSYRDSAYGYGLGIDKSIAESMPVSALARDLWRSRPFDEAPFRGGFHVDGNAVWTSRQEIGFS